MNYSLKQIINALSNLYVNDGDKDGVLDELKAALALLESALEKLDGLSVQGRHVVDTLLGCMMFLEQITGKESGNGGQTNI